MLLNRPLGQQSFIRRRAPLVTNPRDNTAYRDWDNAVDTVITNCSIQPYRLSEKLNFEITVEREFSRTSMRFFCPPETDIESTDRILYDGHEYDVLGHEGAWFDLHGNRHHVAFIGRRREG
jgi:hypothetical protein